MGLRGDSRLRAYAALALAVGGVTWSAIFVRWAGTPGPVSAFYRVLIAAAVLIPWRLAVTPVELDSVRARALRERLPGAIYESGRSQLSLRVPDDPQQRFPAVVNAADVLLSVQREAA